MDDRYGRNRNPKRDRYIAFSIAGVLTLAFFAWAISLTLSQTSQVTSRDISYEILSDTSAKVVFEVSRNPGDTAVCAIQVLSQSYAVVGYKEIQIAPSKGRSTVISAELRTTEKGVSGLVDSCRVK
jgi:hypothetical protein